MAITKFAKPIPGIPLAALDAVGDTKVRDVLRALVGTHNVRNNLAGSGDEAFITTQQALQVARVRGLSDQVGAPRLLARYARGEGGGTYGPGTLSEALATINLSLATAARFQLTLNWLASADASGRTRLEIRNGSGGVLFSQSDSTMGGFATAHVGASGFSLEAGQHALTLHAGNDGGGSYTLGKWGILVMPAAG